MFYRLDSLDRIVEVAPAWDDFAQANGGLQRAHSTSVVGAPLLEFVSGDAARMFVRAALDAARVAGLVRELPYRCDSPTERRLFTMRVRPLGGRALAVEHQLVRAEPRAWAVAARHSVVRWRCSQCLKVRHLGSDEWVEPAVEEIRTLADDVCPACAVRLFQGVGTMASR